MWEIFKEPNKRSKYVKKIVQMLNDSETLYYIHMSADRRNRYDREAMTNIFFFKTKMLIVTIILITTLNKLGLPDIIRWYDNGGKFPIKSAFLVGLSLVIIIIHILKVDDYCINNLVYNNDMNKKKKKTNEFINTIKKDPKNISYAFLRSTVKETFSKVIDSLERMNFEMCQKYMSTECYDELQSQCKRYSFENIGRIIEEPELIEAEPVGIIHHHDSYKDVVWFVIKYNAKDYVVDETDGEILFGSDKVKTFVQYWKFQKAEENTWLLSDVIAKGERDIKKCFNIIEEF
ncbi:Tim44 domain-containing protein [Clostridium beijerinckii]|uniref:Txe/YoeB family toxin of Txe-Axe toxin-antitoxin module n=1 Tax=Clostridium beijerinckii TaxID=1520 RepID=A0AAX0AVU7_CLOBE|nr:Tim44-like domain-containing protein [Clostridium beijerinckii]NRT87180.1 Txe/YoeB family toxin of Txe-Axe toxin-antitoxin module [Clostridium beijerinckii]NYC72612.1 Txe/YoeB family toxin of Txe-Axe toxin-antitoxin module [Clostridium beijerinckii]